MKRIDFNRMVSVKGGVNCFLLGALSLTAPGMIFNLIDVIDGKSYIGDCWNS